MILIQSHSLDESTNDVINELLFLGYKVLRINENTKVSIHKMGLDTITFEVDHVIYDLKQITAFWYRKATTFFDGHLHKAEFSENIKLKLNTWLNTEIEVLRTYWFSALETRCKHLGNYELGTPNKLLFLEQATKVGLSVPATLITSYKEELLYFKAIYKNIITKPIQDVFSIRHEGYFYTSYTNEVTDLEIEQTENTFFPALFQQKIDKKYELRVFYLAGKCYEFIPNGLYDILQDCKTLSINQIKEQYNHEYDETIDEYFEFLVEKEFGFWCEKEELVLFPNLDLAWEEPNLISNAIIDINIHSEHNYMNIFNQLEELGCKHVQIRCYAPKELAYFENILQHLEKRRILSTELITVYQNEFTIANLQNLIEKYPRIQQFIVHSSPKNEITHIDNSGMGNIIFITQIVDNHTHCGSISPAYFSINIKTFTEAQQHNSCLNRKISIDVNGDIKNCPSLPQGFGNIAEVSLQNALLHKNFKDLWLINKDQIEVCKDCEFRYICTDCRAFITNPEDKYSKPSKCTYNPYTAEWEN